MPKSILLFEILEINLVLCISKEMMHRRLSPAAFLVQFESRIAGIL